MLFGLSSRSSHLLNEYFSKRSRHLIKNISFLKKASSNRILDKSQYKLVYDFRDVLPASALLRTKIWVPPVGIALSPVMYVLSGVKTVPILCSVIACAYGISGFVLSKLLKNLVVKIYVKKEGNVEDVLISSLNYIGRRVDRIHKVRDIVNYDFINKVDRTLGLITVSIENSDIVYRINVRENKILDPAVCKHLFGNVWHLNIHEEIKARNKTNLENKKTSDT